MINKDIRKEFPIFEKSEIIYFDNSSSTQKPKCVIESIENYYKLYCSNTGRGSYVWANKVTKEIENVRKKVAQFINCKTNEIVFTFGATHSSNLLSNGWGLNNLDSEDEILLCSTDHKSTVLPWKNVVELLKKFGKNVKINYFESDLEGDYNEGELFKKITPKTKLVVLTHIHNVYGLENSISMIIKEIKEINKDCLVVVDASQSVGHIEVDIEKLNCDFLYFSGHKMFAGNGVGVCYIKESLQKDFLPYMIGGNFERVDFEKNLSKSNLFFENGTINIPSILSLGKAIDFIEEIGIKNIETRIYELTQYLYDKLKEIKEIEFNKGIAKCSCKIGYGIISFWIEGINSSEIGDILSEYNIYVRTGNHCMSTKNEDSIRVSLHIYNTFEEIDIFVDLLKSIIENI